MKTLATLITLTITLLGLTLSLAVAGGPAPDAVIPAPPARVAPVCEPERIVALEREVARLEREVEMLRRRAAEREVEPRVDLRALRRALPPKPPIMRGQASIGRSITGALLAPEPTVLEFLRDLLVP